jgi:hypothetical protein
MNEKAITSFFLNGINNGKGHCTQSSNTYGYLKVSAFNSNQTSKPTANFAGSVMLQLCMEAVPLPRLAAADVLHCREGRVAALRPVQAVAENPEGSFRRDLRQQH